MSGNSWGILICFGVLLLMALPFWVTCCVAGCAILLASGHIYDGRFGALSAPSMR